MCQSRFGLLIPVQSEPLGIKVPKGFLSCHVTRGAGGVIYNHEYFLGASICPFSGASEALHDRSGRTRAHSHSPHMNMNATCMGRNIIYIGALGSLALAHACMHSLTRSLTSSVTSRATCLDISIALQSKFKLHACTLENPMHTPVAVTSRHVTRSCCHVTSRHFTPSCRHTAPRHVTSRHARSWVVITGLSGL